jgi:hypothetical protein
MFGQYLSQKCYTHTYQFIYPDGFSAQMLKFEQRLSSSENVLLPAALFYPPRRT